MRRLCKVGGGKIKGPSEMLLFFSFFLFLTRKEGRKSHTPWLGLPESLTPRSKEKSSAWLQRRARWELQSYPGSCWEDWFENTTTTTTQIPSISAGPKLRGYLTHTKAPFANANLVIGHLITLFAPINKGVFLQGIIVHLKCWPQARNPLAFVNS